MDSKKADEPRTPLVGQPYEVKSSGRYRLRAEHVLGDRHLEAMTEVGTDTGIPWPSPPTPLMEGVDPAGIEAVRKLHKELYNALPPWDFENNPDYAIHEERRKEQEKETESEPVSAAQAWERGKDWKGPVPTPARVLTKGGDVSGGVSLPAMNVDKPNEEQYPKG